MRTKIFNRMLIGCILTMLCIGWIQLLPGVSAAGEFDAEADYWTNFESEASKLDNVTMTLNGWTHTNVTSWDGSNAKYFNSSVATGDLRFSLQKPLAGGVINDAKGVYYEFQYNWNTSVTTAGWNSISLVGVGTFDYSWRILTSVVYMYTIIGTKTTYWYLPMSRSTFGDSWHRTAVHFNNITGEVSILFDNYYFTFMDTPKAFAPTSTNIYVVDNGRPGLIFDNIKCFKDQVFPLDEYFTDFYGELNLAFPPNNYDFVCKPFYHADYETLNRTVPISDFFEEYNIYADFTHFYNGSNSVNCDELGTNASLATWVRNNQEDHGQYAHTMAQNYNWNTTGVLSRLNAWKNLIGNYPKLWVDHGGIENNYGRNGSNVTNEHYIGGLRNDSSMKYIWFNWNYDEPETYLPKYDYYSRNSNTAFKYWDDSPKLIQTSAVYNISALNDGNPATNLFTSGSGGVLATFKRTDYNWFTYTQELCNDRALYIAHAYHANILYKNISGTKYTDHSPLPAGYSDWTFSSWYMDATNPWMVHPESREIWDNITGHYSIWGHDLTDILLDRSVVWNESSIYQDGNTIYVDTPTTLNNITVWSRSNRTGKALNDSGTYYVFTKGSYQSWGATIPSNNGNISYELENWSLALDDNNNIGRLVYESNGDVDIHCKESGVVTLQLATNESPDRLWNYSSGSTLAFIHNDTNVTFTGDQDGRYYFDMDYTAPVTPTVPYSETTNYLTHTVLPILIAVVIIGFIIGLIGTVGFSKEVMITILIVVIIGVITIQVLIGL